MNQLKRMIMDASLEAKIKVEKMKLKGEALDYIDKILKKLSSLTNIPFGDLKRMNSHQLSDVIDDLYDENKGKARQADQLLDAFNDIMDAMRRIGSVEFIPYMKSALSHNRKFV